MDPSLNEIWQVVFRCAALRDIALNVRHYRISNEVGNGATAQVAANFFATTFGPVYAAVMSTGSFFDYVTIQRIDPLPLGVSTFSTNAAVQGTVADDILPNQVCGAITLTTAFAGQGFRGRVYVPYPTEGDNTDGEPTGAYVASLAALTALFTTPIVAGGAGDNTTFSPVLWNRAGRIATPLMGALARSYWTTQRRRNNKRF